MKNLQRFTLTLLLGGLTCAPLAAQSEKEIQADFAARFSQTDHRAPQPLEGLSLTAEQREALQFLYAYMAWPDLTDYAPEYYLKQADYALRARREMPWGKKVPHREWLHFVLPPRVNNENLDDFRSVCYEQLKRRVAGLSMRDAVLEVNHWCHEYVTYKPSDARTSSPLASMRTATGRCGEESTFTVAALRAIGIPARQVYTPRWAHTDDNHAWVEAWVDGKWQFLGACEPEPVLNLGWFNQPASRGMLMHTRVFGRYDGPEDVMSRTACYTEINVTENYAPVARTTVRVVDKEGKAIASAHVEFKLYNYAELYTVMTTTTDHKGRAYITAGLGDLVVWAAADGECGFKKFTVGKDKNVEVEVGPMPQLSSVEFNIVPPAGRNNMPKVSAEAAAENARRAAREDSIRTAYVRTFPDAERVKDFCRQTGLDFERVAPLAEKSKGNYAALFRLLRQYPGHFTLCVLESLSEKDLRDFNPAVLADHIAACDTSRLDASVYCPRIANEWLTPWRSYLKKAFTEQQKEMFCQSPQRLAEWVAKEVATDTVWNPLGFCLSPESAHRWRRADLRSKGILFVAAARSLNIPAQIDAVTGNVQYDAGGRWQTVELSGKSNEQTVQTPAATLSLDYTPREYMENPGYYYHFTLSHLKGGMPQLLNYGETDTWKENFKCGTEVEAGRYLLTSGTRMADGSVLARLSFFPVIAGQNMSTPLVMREDKSQVQVIGNFNSENRYFDVKAGKEQSVLAHTGRGYFVVGLIRANHEPTNHILHDLSKQREALEAWGRPILLLFPSQEELERFENNRAEFKNLPSTLSFGVDASGQVRKDLMGGSLTHSEELPVVIIGDTFNRVVFCSQGYTIGIGEQLRTTIGKI